MTHDPGVELPVRMFLMAVAELKAGGVSDEEIVAGLLSCAGYLMLSLVPDDVDRTRAMIEAARTAATRRNFTRGGEDD